MHLSLQSTWQDHGDSFVTERTGAQEEYAQSEHAKQ